MWVELSYEYAENMPVYPGCPREQFQPHNRISRGAENNTTIIQHFLHGGTHVDAPFHFDEKGKPIDQIPIEDFVYHAPLLVQKELKKSELLEVEDLKGYGNALYSSDILLLYTGYCKLRGDAAVYADNFPAISEKTAQFIRTELVNLKAIAIDTLSIENADGPKTHFRVHRTLLNREWYDTRPLLIYEDVNLEKVLNQSIKRIYAFPLRLKGLDASPVNIVAEV
jgi:kynurenine formamidase